MKKERNFDVILAAGGSGSRFGGEKNKILADLKGKTVLWHSLALFGSFPGVKRMVIPCRPKDKKAIETLVKEWENARRKEAKAVADPEVILVEGGKERQDSVYQALQHCREDWVLIHDGARPFATHTMIEDCLKALKKYPAVTTGVLSKDTIKLVNGNMEVESTTDRSRSYLVQTPQGFWRKELAQAHEQFKGEAFTDDCSLLERIGHKVKIVPGAYENIKITTPEDLE